MAMSVLHGLGQVGDAQKYLNSCVSQHLRVGRRDAISDASRQGVATMMARSLNCPITTSAGRWFDAVAGLLGVCWWQTAEAQAAQALEQLAEQWLARYPAPVLDAALMSAGLDLRVLMQCLLLLVQQASSDDGEQRHSIQQQAAALFHVALAQALADAAAAQAQRCQLTSVALSGGCFFNRVLRDHTIAALECHGLTAHPPPEMDCGDAGLALGQAWVAAHCLVDVPHGRQGLAHETRNSLCV
jgi:hydrogenase maturation protein HypF